MFYLISKRSFLGLILCVFLSAAAAFGQNSTTLSGTITDSNGAVIVGATVKALNLGSNREFTVSADGNGKYLFTDLPAGSYRVSAASQGFAENAENIIVGDGANATRDFSLSPGSIQDVVTVTAGKGNALAAVDVPQTVTVTTAEDLEQRRPRSTFEALERTPNIIPVETSPARERPRLRGLDSTRVLIVIDGERLNNARTDLNTGLSPSIIDVTQLESTEVVSGAGSSLYGSDSLAGTINLITKGPTRPNDGLLLSFRFDGNYSSNGKVRRGAGVINLSNPQIAFRIGGSLFRNDNYNIGNRGITQDEVLSFGRFYTSIPTGVPNAAGVFSTNSPSGFPIFSVPAGGEISNGQGHGGNGQIDMWFYPTEKHNFRGRYITSQHSNLGNAFSGPPYETQERFNPFRDYDKFGLRYEALGLTKWLPRFSLNFYHQKLSFPQAQFDYSNLAATAASPLGGSYLGTAFTGAPSAFRISTFTSNKNTITTDDIDAQATLAPFAGLFVTVGAQSLKDASRDEFINYPFFNFDRTTPNFAAGQRGASSPNTDYKDRAAFFQAEFDRIKWFRLSGGMRIDNWRTRAMPSPEFPLGFEFGILTTATPFVQANPGPLASQVASLPKITQLASRSGDVTTDRNAITGSIGGVLRLPYGINPYLRYGTSYREPSITERYIIRNFNTGIQGFYALVVGNPNLEPERGRNLDAGVKVQGRNYNGSFGYFRNNLSNLNVFRTPDFGNICAVPAAGLPGLPFPFLGCAPGRALISYNARVNQGGSLITGFEGTGEYSQSLGRFGSINPFVSFGTLHGTNKSPSALEFFIIDRTFNNSATPIKLTGSRDDVPLGNITPFRLIGGAQYNDKSGRFFVEYSFRRQDRVTRAAPTGFNGSTLINYGTFASLNGFTKHDIRGGYTYRAERYRVSLTAGIQNFTDKLYWEHFQNAPAPGRSFIFGITTELFNILKK